MIPRTDGRIFEGGSRNLMRRRGERMGVLKCFFLLDMVRVGVSSLFFSLFFSFGVCVRGGGLLVSI